MAIADFDEYVSLLRQNRVADFQMAGTSAPALRMGASYRQFVPTVATPTASVALNNTSDVAIGPLPDSSTGKLCTLAARLNTSGISGVSLTLVDLLNQSGGLNATVITEQTTNLPTAALTRYTSGEGVRIGLVVYTQLGTTATTVTVRYTNQAGTPNRVSTATSFGGTSFREATRLIPIPLQAGDTGVRSVEGVTLAASTATAGNFGVVLFKPLTVIAMESTTGAMPLDNISSGGIIGAFQEFDETACLAFISIMGVAGQTINGTFPLAEA